MYKFELSEQRDHKGDIMWVVVEFDDEYIHGPLAPYCFYTLPEALSHIHHSVVDDIVAAMPA